MIALPMETPFTGMQKKPQKCLFRSDGFTLVELVLATLISTLVIAILSVALTFSMKMWERQRNREVSELPMLIELMALQIMSFDATPLQSELGAAKELFVGDEHSLTLATDYSVKAISGGIPVVARYVYQPREKVLYYAEMPMDPYHDEPLRDFLAMKPGDKSSWPRFHPIDVEGFSILYLGEEDESYGEVWNQEESIPKAVLVKWTSEGESFSRMVAPDLLFSSGQQTKDTSLATGVNSSSTKAKSTSSGSKSTTSSPKSTTSGSTSGFLGAK